MLLRKFHDIKSKAFSKSINTNKHFLKNWRPISLLNTVHVYKIGSGVIANRIKKVLPTLINNDQTGFIAGSIRLLSSINSKTFSLDFGLFTCK
jgi:hypothetical protein